MTTDDTTPEAPARAGCPGWIKLLLVGSLALNVAIAGLFIGNAMKDDDRPRGPYRQIEWIVRLVPEEKRDFTRAHFEAHKEKIRELRAARRGQMELILAAIRAEPFVPEELETALAEHRAASSERRTVMHSATVELLSQFTADERAVFAKNIQERLTKRYERDAD